MKRPHKTDHSKQARDFISNLHANDWRSLTIWEDAGHSFEMLQKTGTIRRIIVQIYPDGDGFEVWRPVCAGNSIAETAAAVEKYAEAFSL